MKHRCVAVWIIAVEQDVRARWPHDTTLQTLVLAFRMNGVYLTDVTMDHDT